MDIDHNGKSYLGFTAEAALAAGVPDSVIKAAQKEVVSNLINGECRRRIYAIASAETQMNMASASAVVSAKAVEDRTDADTALLAGLAAAIEWVGAMRAASKSLAADPEAEFLSDKSWPDLPAAAAAVVDMF